MLGFARPFSICTSIPLLISALLASSSRDIPYCLRKLLTRLAIASLIAVLLFSVIILTIWLFILDCRYFPLSLTSTIRTTQEVIMFEFISVFVMGAVISGGLIIAIGSQNAFLLKTGLRSEEHTSELQSRPHLVC